MIKQAVGFALAVAAAFAGSTPGRAADPPNVVVVFIDDMGYADIGPFGCTAYATPNLDRIAAEGRVFTDFQVTSAVCSESRASLLTGCYSKRVGIRGALFPGERIGLNPDETTIAEVCRSRGYATACYGKWHLGDRPEFLPTSQGFEEYLGLPYSNDMWPYLNGEETIEAGVRHWRGKPMPPLPLYENEQIVDADVSPEDQKRLTGLYTERAVDFIERHAGERPFFLYVPHTMVHVPLYVSEEFAGTSGAGLYGDVVAELDWSVGEILRALAKANVDDNTLVVFTSDNGPWLSFGDHAGSAGPLREGKGTLWEGGVRVPCVMRWPNRIPAGSVCDELVSAMDLLPTISNLIGADSPSLPIDGKDATALLVGDATATPHEVLYGYYGGGLRFVRDARWKLILPHEYPTLGGNPAGSGGKSASMQKASAGLELYDLENDLGETTDVAADRPEVVSRLLEHAEAARSELGDRLTDRRGSGVRPIGRVE